MLKKIRLKVERQVHGKPIQQPGDVIVIAKQEAERLIKIGQAEVYKAKKKEK